MYELLYTSLAVKVFSDDELLDLLSASRANNTRREITGMLVHVNGEFVQLLEGEKSAVQALFTKIKGDPRHKTVTVFYEGAIRRRAFEQWSMAFKSLPDVANAGAIPGLEAFSSTTSPANLIAANPNVGKELFLGLRKTL